MSGAVPDLSKISGLRRVRLVKCLLHKWATASLPPGRELTPEQQMWLDVICRAIDDFLEPPGTLGPYSPRHYFNSEFPFAMHAHLVNLEPVAVLEVLKQVGFTVEPHALACAEAW